ncbi:MAG: Holliday junction resolvase RuvX [Bacilli bacterium]|nr:Holliday junction resolvase RuvX [Bacilli bacterium]MDD4733785.1 Holliday junction resolvase RuvX [Bacilli bacterium]
MRYLGLDLGTKTLGLSLSDKTGTIANSYKVIRFENENYSSLLLVLKEVIEKEKVDCLILGLPKNMNNTIGERATITLQFKEMIEKELKKEVILMDERLSTVSAHNYMIESNMSRKKRKEKVDSVAATIILQNYLDKKRG